MGDRLYLNTIKKRSKKIINSDLKKNNVYTKGMTGTDPN